MTVKDYFLTCEEFQLVKTEIDGVLKTFPVPKNPGKYYDSPKYISHHQEKKDLKTRIYKFIQGINLNYKKNILRSNVPAGGTVLDYGCGAGNFLVAVQDEFTVQGYEPNDQARKVAASKLQNGNFVTDIDKVPDASLDAITLWHVLEHIDNQQDTLNIFHNKLKDSGILIIAVPNHASFDAKKYGKFWAAYDVPRHLYHYTKSGMTQFLQKSGWQLREIKPLHLDAFYISALSEKYKNSLLPWVRGGVSGAISNFKAVKTGEFSSLIYIVEKKL